MNINENELNMNIDKNEYYLIYNDLEILINHKDEKLKYFVGYELNKIINFIKSINYNYYCKYLWHPDYDLPIFINDLPIKMINELNKIDLIESYTISSMYIFRDLDNIKANNINKYIIYHKSWNILLEIIKIINNLDDKHYRTIKYTNIHIITNYLILYPDNIICKILNTFSYNIRKIIVYYVSYKLIKTKYIPFELFPINNNKLLYTTMLLINDEYFKINLENNNELKINIIKFNYIFNKLHYDLKLKICSISNINFNEIRLSSMYLI